VGRLGPGFVFENPRALDRAFLVSRSIAIQSASERLRFLAGPEFDPARVVVVETGTGETLPDAPGSVRIHSRSPGAYELEAESPGGAFLVLAESHFPGWSVDVDGAPAELLRANHLVQAVRLPPGRHRVLFSYRSRFLLPGFGIAALTILLPAIVAAVKRRRRAVPGA